MPRPRERAEAVDLAFADPEGAHGGVRRGLQGQIVAERYMPGITKDTQLESWSMGKSLTATLFALLVKDGVYTLNDPAPVPVWRSPGDPRGAIRDRDLLHMSSGLRFIAARTRGDTPDKGYPRSLLHLHRRHRRVQATRSTRRWNSRRTPTAAIATPIR